MLARCRKISHPDGGRRSFRRNSNVLRHKPAKAGATPRRNIRLIASRRHPPVINGRKYYLTEKLCLIRKTLNADATDNTWGPRWAFRYITDHGASATLA